MYPIVIQSHTVSVRSREQRQSRTVYHLNFVLHQLSINSMTSRYICLQELSNFYYDLLLFLFSAIEHYVVLDFGAL